MPKGILYNESKAQCPFKHNPSNMQSYRWSHTIAKRNASRSTPNIPIHVMSVVAMFYDAYGMPQQMECCIQRGVNHHWRLHRVVGTWHGAYTGQLRGTVPPTLTSSVKELPADPGSAKKHATIHTIQHMMVNTNATTCTIMLSSRLKYLWWHTRT